MDITKRQITKIAREVSKFTVRTLRAEGIGASEFDVIHAVRKNPGTTQAIICAITGMDKGAVARRCANLEAKGYLTREENSQDKRSRKLFATEASEKLKNSKAHIEAKFFEYLTSELTEDEKTVFSEILDKIYNKCKAESKAGFVNMKELMENDRK